MAFRVGQKVVCVSARVCVTPGPEPVFGSTYTIREIETDYKGDLGLRLQEIQKPISHHHNKEYGFYAFRFRPLIEKSTDTGMAILREILDRETVNDRVPIRAQ